MATDPVLAARSRLALAVKAAGKTGDFAPVWEARKALVQAKTARMHDEFAALVAAAPASEQPPIAQPYYCCPKCRTKGACK